MRSAIEPISAIINLKEDYHVHCNYNDHSAPDMTVENVISYARKMGLQTLAFTEHVRRSSNWIPQYLKEIELVSRREDDRNATATIPADGNKSNKLKIIPGFEAKILADGQIDCPKEYSEKYFLVASFHTKYEEKGMWLSALQQAIKNPDVNVIGHIAPEPSFELDDMELNALSQLIVGNNKVVEINVKYHRPPYRWLETFKKNGVHFHLGSDAHALYEIGRFDSVLDLISIAMSQ